MIIPGVEWSGVWFAVALMVFDNDYDSDRGSGCGCGYGIAVTSHLHFHLHLHLHFYGCFSVVYSLRLFRPVLFHLVWLRSASRLVYMIPIHLVFRLDCLSHRRVPIEASCRARFAYGYA